jgi:hypothetical protein
MAVLLAWRWRRSISTTSLQLYDSIDMGDNGVINLIADDASIIVRRPFNEADIGTSLAKAHCSPGCCPLPDQGRLRPVPSLTMSSESSGIGGSRVIP